MDNIKNFIIIDNDKISKKSLEELLLETTNLNLENKETDNSIIIVSTNTKNWKKYINYNNPILILVESDFNDITPENNICIKKPFTIQNLSKQIQKTIEKFANDKNNILSFSKFQINKKTKDITNLDTNTIQELTDKEIEIIEELYNSPKNTKNKNSLLKDVWGYSNAIDTHTLETHIYRLRKKIENDPSDPKIITTIKDSYKLEI